MLIKYPSIIECMDHLELLLGVERNRQFQSIPFEQNTGRALTKRKKVFQGCIRVGTYGIRTSSATDNCLDIKCGNDDFDLVVEMVSCTRCRHLEKYGLRTSRYFGKVQRFATNPTYCLFIANSLPAYVVAHFFNLNRFKTAAYGGQTSIIPVDLSTFREMLIKAKDENLQDSHYLKKFLQRMVEQGRAAEDETQWLSFIQASAQTWCEV